MAKTKTLLSWNVNGIRAVLRKGVFFELLDQKHPDVLCVQETKAQPEQLEADVLNHDSYFSYWHSASTKKGYSGVATFTKEQPIKVEQGFGIEKFDAEGRCLMTEFKEFVLFNVYFPNGKMGIDRLNYKLEFYNAFLKHIDSYVKKGKRVVFCGDVNTAHREIDLARPKSNEKVSGFLPVERKWIDQVVNHGYIDTLRQFHPESDLYTWWDLKSAARTRNVGWRIDYFFIDSGLKKNLTDAFILSDVMGSDHCPVGIKLHI